MDSSDEMAASFEGPPAVSSAPHAAARLLQEITNDEVATNRDLTALALAGINEDAMEEAGKDA